MGPTATRSALRIGCCGFPVARARYFRTFPVVEIQQTFYQPPSLQTARRWRDAAPPGFEFTLKVWQLITHPPTSPTYRRLHRPLTEHERREAGGFQWTPIVLDAWATSLAVARELRADKLLFQCPASFGPTDVHVARLEQFFRSIDRAGIVCLWEPRGAWPRDLVGELCRALNLVHCVDPFAGESATDGLRYWRLHGIGGYRYQYSDAELANLAPRLADRRPSYVLFNNSAMWFDALRFTERAEHDGLEPVRP